jgi:hypothetical protein
MELKYKFEYFCSPIWVKNSLIVNSIFENINIETLPISNRLKIDLTNLNNVYQSTYNDEYPPKPKELSKNEEISFCENVIDSAKRLSDELRTKYMVVFDKKYWGNKIAKLQKENSA